MELLADRSGKNRIILKNVPQDAGEIKLIILESVALKVTRWAK